MAREGRTEEQILEHYYRGTEVGAAQQRVEQRAPHTARNGVSAPPCSTTVHA